MELFSGDFCDTFSYLYMCFAGSHYGGQRHKAHSGLFPVLKGWNVSSVFLRPDVVSVVSADLHILLAIQYFFTYENSEGFEKHIVTVL